MRYCIFDYNLKCQELLKEYNFTSHHPRVPAKIQIQLYQTSETSSKYALQQRNIYNLWKSRIYQGIEENLIGIFQGTNQKLIPRLLRVLGIYIRLNENLIPHLLLLLLICVRPICNFRQLKPRLLGVLLICSPPRRNFRWFQHSELRICISPICNLMIKNQKIKNKMNFHQIIWYNN